MKTLSQGLPIAPWFLIGQSDLTKTNYMPISYQVERESSFVNILEIVLVFLDIQHCSQKVKYTFKSLLHYIALNA